MEQERFDVGSAEKTNYTDFLELIKKKMDPESNYVILVDDEMGIRKKVARDIKSFDTNIQILEASDGQQALIALEKGRNKYKKDPLFMVIDLNMPVMDGWALIERMKKDYEANGKIYGIPVIVLSSTSGEKGMLFMKKSVHAGAYQPLVAIAKENCTDNKKYAGIGEKNLVEWLRHFAKER
jgi:CheY-like chemotaxis protein